MPRLLDAGFRVRCLARTPDKLRDVPWLSRVEVVGGDVTSADDVTRALEGVDIVYYLVHSLAGVGFEETDRAAATCIARQAPIAGVRRLVYLGGIEPAHGALSPHLRSRAEVGRILQTSGVPTIVLQSAVVLGSGSASFEMLRYLTERLPVMVTPRWVRNRVQPIAVRDVLRHLVACAQAPDGARGTFDIGGRDVVTYQELMQCYAKLAGLRPRVIVPVPVLSPRLSSYWVNIVTPVPGRLARPLVESLRHEMICSSPPPSWSPDPPGGALGVEEAIRLAVEKVRDGAVETRWSSAAWSGVPSDPLPTDPAWAGGSVYVDEREVEVDASVTALWGVVEAIGGENGWYSYPLLWAARGHLDRLVGGVGLARGRRDPDRLAVGDSLDWWRVEERLPAQLLRLRAEMRVPGLAWLEMSVDDVGSGRSRYRQRAIFQPRGLAGHAYWRGVAPFHGLVFGGMVRNIKAAAERAGATTRSAA